MKRKTKRKKKNSKAILLLIIPVIISICFVVLNGKGFFSIETIDVQGNVSLTDEQIILASGIKTGDSLVNLSEKRGVSNIKTLIYIKQANISKVYPHTVKITVIERAAFAALCADGIYYETDSEGIILFSGEDSGLMSSVLVTGSGASVEQGALYIDWVSNSKLKTAYDVIFFLSGQDLTQYVSELHVSEVGCYYLYTNKSNVLKFYSLNAFSANESFIKEFLKHEERNIMVEVVDGVNPVYKEIDIK